MKQFTIPKLLSLRLWAVIALFLCCSQTLAQCPSRFELFEGDAPRTIDGALWDPLHSNFIVVQTPYYRAQFGETWVSDGASWSLRDTAGPTNLRTSMLAWDSARAVAVAVTGGTDPATARQTWEWNGLTWTRRADVPLAFPVSGVLAYDSLRSKTVLITDMYSPSAQNLMLEWDGSTWTQRAVSNPSARRGEGLVYDPVRHRLVMFGGVGQPPPGLMIPPPLDDTWEFDGTAWTQMSGTNKPPAGQDSCMVFDPAAGKVLLISQHSNDSWYWDGVQWTTSGSDLLYGAWPIGLGVEAQSGRRWMVSVPNSGSIYSKLPNTQWVRLFDAGVTQPETSGSQAMAFDRRRGVLVEFGGRNAQGTALVSGSTWEFDGNGWAKRTFASGPSPREMATAVYDEVRQKVVVVGGWNQTSYFPETWEYDGASWALVSTNSVAARRGASLAFDPIRHVTVMYGGYGASGELTDTCEWNGSSWTVRIAGGGAPAGGSLFFDRNLGAVLGCSNSGTLRYNGLNAWTQQSAVGAAHPVWDDAMGTAVAWLGSNYPGGGMWRWTGTDWTSIAFTSAFRDVSDTTVYDARRDRLIIDRGINWGLWELFRPTADVGQAGGLSGPDGHLDNNDFIVFINRFFQEDARADIGGAGGLAAPDGRFDNNDFIAFINLFFDGCGL